MKSLFIVRYKPSACLKKLFICGYVMLWMGASISLAAQTVFEKPPVLEASKILGPDLLSGPYHRLDDKIDNDGYVNSYTIHSTFGEFKAESTAMLRIRISEVGAIHAMEQVKNSKEYGESVKESADDIGEGAKALVTQPEETLKGTATGVGLLFKRGAESLFMSKPGLYEDSRAKALIGFSKTKRDYAKEFGVDVYSSNPVLQERLDEIAWTGYAGGLTVSALAAAIPGGAGIAVSGAGGTDLLNEVIATTPPSDLRRMNREKLKKMDINADVIDLFIDNPALSPRHQTLMVAALESMPETREKMSFVKFAVLAINEEVALFAQQVVQMHAGYHRKIDKIEEFIPFGSVIASRSARGKLVAAAPLDYVIWNIYNAEIFQAFDEYAKRIPAIKDKELWLTGGLSPMTRKHLEDTGWKIFENGENRLLNMSP
jgi:hypothetical protein